MSVFPSLWARAKTSLFLAGIFGLLIGLGYAFGPRLVFWMTLSVVGVLALKEWTAMCQKRSQKIFFCLNGLCLLIVCFYSFFRIEREDGWKLIFWVIGLAVLSDTTAYLAGSWLKGPKLCPQWSPKKTISGALVSLVLVTALGAWVGQSLWGWKSYQALIIALIVALSAQAGDLVESFAKRKCGVKDSGTCLAGHGGILDRIDSWLGAAFGMVFIANNYVYVGFFFESFFFEILSSMIF